MRPATLFKNSFWPRCSPVNSKNTFSYRTPPVAAFDISSSQRAYVSSSMSSTCYWIIFVRCHLLFFIRLDSPVICLFCLSHLFSRPYLFVIFLVLPTVAGCSEKHLTLSWITLKNGQTYFKNLAVFSPQDF